MCECQICIKVNKLKVLLLILHLIFPDTFKISNKNFTLHHKAVAIIRISDSMRTFHSFSYAKQIIFFIFIRWNKNG